MKSWLTFFSLLVLVVVPTRAQDEGKAAVASEARKQYSALLQEFDRARQEYFEGTKKAKTDAERAGLKYPEPEQYVRRFLDLAKTHPKDGAAVDALIWIAQSSRSGPELDESLDLLRKDYIDSEGLHHVALALVYTQTDRTEDWLKTVAEKSPHAQVRGNALYALGQFYFRMSGDAMFLKQSQLGEEQLRQWAGEKYVARLKTDTANGWRKRSEQLFEEVAGKYSGVVAYRGTLADAAKNELFEIRELAIGKVAPEIEGEDLDGNRFKLSDYRGKVVVIDFWGDW